jgi:hypothetical protein
MLRRNAVGTVQLARIALVAALSPTLFVPPATADPIRHASVTLLDSLAGASPATTFSVFGSGGISILENQFVGPQFVVNRRTTLTEVGGFINNCESISGGVPNCPGVLPFRVEIRGAVNGVPDLSRVLASVPLSDDQNPLRTSFESASLRLPLSRGTYFALFVAEPGQAGFILGSALDPFAYQPGIVRLGDVRGAQSSVIDTFAAVRVLGEAHAVPEPTTLLMVGSAGLGLVVKVKRRKRQAAMD